MRSVRATGGNLFAYLRYANLFESCLVVSVVIHLALYGVWHIKGSIIPAVSSDEIDFRQMDIDFKEIPPELLGGDTEPAPVEIQDWVEGSNRDKNSTHPVENERDPNAVSGTGTDKEGYLFPVKGDRPPRPVFNFDLKRFFPYEARKASITNRVVVVRVKVDDDGSLISSTVVSGAAGYGFDEAAIEVLRLARFVPGYRNGVPVKMVHDLAVRFVLDDSRI
jgi:protein TonB